MTTDTKLAPTDAELLGLNVGEVYFSESPSKYPEVHGTQYHAGAPGVLAFARAVLDKWGQPAHSGEPVAWKHDCSALLTNDVELWIDACPHCGKPRNAPPPVERVPLTDGLEMALEQLVNRCNNGHDSSTWDEVIAAEAALERLYKSRAIEAAHGIKGGQHGTE